MGYREPDPTMKLEDAINRASAEKKRMQSEIDKLRKHKCPKWWPRIASGALWCGAVAAGAVIVVSLVRCANQPDKPQTCRSYVETIGGSSVRCSHDSHKLERVTDTIWKCECPK